MNSKHALFFFIAISLLSHLCLLLIPFKKITEQENIENLINASIVSIPEVKKESNNKTRKNTTLKKKENSSNLENNFLQEKEINKQAKINLEKNKEEKAEHPVDNTLNVKRESFNKEKQPNSNPFAELIKRINSAKEDNYPLAARKMGYQASIEMEIELDPYGNLKKLTIVKSCKYKILNKAAEKLIYEIMQEPYPHNIGKDVLLRIPIRYILK